MAIWNSGGKRDYTRYVTTKDYSGIQSGNKGRAGMARRWADSVNKKVDEYWADVRAKEIAAALAAHKRSTPAPAPAPKPAPAPVAAPSSAAPSKPYDNIPGVDSYKPRERNKPSNALSDSTYNYGEDYNSGEDYSSGDYSNRYGNKQGLIDRGGSIEDPQSLLDSWIFKIRNDEKLNASTRVDKIANEDFNDDDDDRRYSRYDTRNYY